MTKKLNIDKIAKLAGVSTATVSRVLNDYPFVKESTRDRVLQVIKKTQYRVNAVARNLRRRKTLSIGMIISNVLSSFYSVLAKAVEDVAIRNNYSTILCNGGDSAEKERKYLKVLHENRVDGIILYPTGRNADYLNFLISSGIPVTFIDRITQGVECDCVLVNNREATRRAIEFVIDRGYRKVGCIAGPMDRTTGIERLRGYSEALVGRGVSFDEKLVKYGDFSVESGRKMMGDLIESVEIDAVFVSNFDMATGAFQIIKEKGVKIPDDIGFLMFDDSVWTSLVTPSVTAISQPVYALGTTAAELLFQRILNGSDYMEKKPVKVVLQTKLIVRESI
jgi:DNA-binding LacI/PurR family transcriptional regulator